MRAFDMDSHQECIESELFAPVAMRWGAGPPFWWLKEVELDGLISVEEVDEEGDPLLPL